MLFGITAREGLAAAMLDEVDRALLALLQRDATQPYAALGQAVGLSAAAAHERVRKLRERGVIRRTTIDVDPVAVGRGVLSFVMLDAGEWMGDPPTRAALEALPQVQEAHVVAGSASVLLKVRTATTEELQSVLRRAFDVAGVTGTHTIVVLETFFERPVDPHPDPRPGAHPEPHAAAVSASPRSARASRTGSSESAGR